MPQVSWNGLGGRKSSARQRAVPLGPRRVRFVSEVPRRDGAPLLPPAVGWLGRLVERVRTVRDVTDKDGLDAVGVDVGERQTYDTGMSSRDATSRDTLR